LRERSLIWAILASQSLIVMSGLTHPMGLLPFFGLLCLSLYFDRKSIGFKHVLIALTPYVIFGAAWLSYVLQDPSSFVSQFFGNAMMGSEDSANSRFVGPLATSDLDHATPPPLAARFCFWCCT
jgi:uncharacterized membrane protein